MEYMDKIGTGLTSSKQSTISRLRRQFGTIPTLRQEPLQ
jgi:hypothetical protein